MSGLEKTIRSGTDAGIDGRELQRPDNVILAPGRNCWRVDNAGRAAVMIDGAAYFANLESALRQARHSIRILGWDFDGSIRLRPDVSEEESPQLDALLRSLVDANPDLSLHILIWSSSVAHAPGAIAPALFGAEWQEHPRIAFRLDTHHPIYAAHHQKVVCIDDTIAFVGGIDMTIQRWDTREHVMGDPNRREPDGNPYTPVHDMQMVVDGDAACSVAELARARWHAATDEELAAVRPDGGDPWPAGLVPDFVDVPVAIARTMPEYGRQAAVSEAAALTADALSDARRTVYIETQYLTARFVRDILADKLADPDGPEVVILMPHRTRGMLERFAMGTNSERLIHRLTQADHHGRLRVYYPRVPSKDGAHQVLVHAKLVIVDDRFLRVGSSNLNNRSVGLDTECDLAIEAGNARERKAIAHLRENLLAEHLGTNAARVGRAIREKGALIAAIEHLNTGPRGLEPHEVLGEEGSTRFLFGTRLLDPKRPYEPLRRLGMKDRNER